MGTCCSQSHQARWREKEAAGDEEIADEDIVNVGFTPSTNPLAPEEDDDVLEDPVPEDGWWDMREKQAQEAVHEAEATLAVAVAADDPAAMNTAAVAIEAAKQLLSAAQEDREEADGNVVAVDESGAADAWDQWESLHTNLPAAESSAPPRDVAEEMWDQWQAIYADESRAARGLDRLLPEKQETEVPATPFYWHFLCLTFRFCGWWLLHLADCGCFSPRANSWRGSE